MSRKSKTHAAKDAYEFYVMRGGGLEWSQWMDIVSRFNQEAMDEIIFEGRELEMGSGLSRISVVRIDRNHAAPRVDWKATTELRDELIAEGATLLSDENPDGVPYLVYYTDDWYCRFFWEKRNCRLRNKSAYRFDATRGLKGNKTKLVQHLQSDDLAYLKYDKA